MSALRAIRCAFAAALFRAAFTFASGLMTRKAIVDAIMEAYNEELARSRG